MNTKARTILLAIRHALNGLARLRTRPLLLMLFAFLALQTSGRAAVTSGTYVGDGVNGKAINVGFQPDIVFLQRTDGSSFMQVRTSVMPFTKDVGSYVGSSSGTDRILSLTSNGFTVGTSATANASGVSYQYLAISQAANEVKVGSYNGNGLDNRDITGIGFQPSFVLTLRDGSTSTWRNSSMPPDTSSFWDSFGAAPDCIQTLLPDGFQVGTDATANASGSTYYYIACKDVPGKFRTGTYSGTGTPRSITGIGFQPEAVFIKRSTTTSAGVKWATSGATTDSSTGVVSAGLLTNVITSLDSDGFSLGTSTRVNTAASDYYYFAFAPVAAVSLSNNANLSALALSSGGFAPSFSQTQQTYTATVANATASITVTATKADANAQGIEVRVNGGAYAATPSGSASGALALNVGNNPVDIRVTAQDGSQKVYTVTVTRAASNDANLSALTLTAGTLNPGFSPAIQVYTAAVTNATSTIKVTPTQADPSAQGIDVRVNGGTYTAVPSGTASGLLSLNVGANPIDVRVTAQDGSQKVYTVTVTRAASSNANLSSLALSSGTLSPVFASATLPYSATIANAITGVKVTAVLADLSAQGIEVRANGGAFAALPSGTPGSLLPMNVGGNSVEVRVTAQDGSQQTYTIAVTKLASTNADLSSLTLSAGTLNPGFSAGVLSYTASVSNATTTLQVTPVQADPQAQAIEVRVNGGAYAAVASNTASAALPLNAGSNPVDVRVTAQSGAQRVYTVDVTRSAPAYDIPVTLAAGILNIDASTASGATNIVLRYVAGGFLEIFDATRSVGASGGMTQVNANTVRIPLAGLAQLSITGSSFADTFTLDFSAGDICPTGGITVNGAGPTTSPGDTLVVDGDFTSGGVYGATGIGAGILTLDSSNTVTFTGLEPVDLSLATFPTFTVTVDPNGTFNGDVSTTVAAVDAGVNTEITFGASGLESVKLGLITASLIIEGDDVENDYITLTGVGTSMLGDLTVNGRGGNSDVIDIHGGTITLDLGKNLTLKADMVGIGKEVGGLNAGIIEVSGDILIEADGDNSITTPPLWGLPGVWGSAPPAHFSNSTLFTQRGSLQLRGNINKSSGADATATLKARASIGMLNISGAAGAINGLSNKLHVVINADSDETGGGSVILQNLCNIQTNGGDLTIGGGANPALTPAIGVAGGGFTAGVLMNNVIVNSAGGDISIRGQGFAGDSGFGVYITASPGLTVPTIQTGAGLLAITGTGGGAPGTSLNCPGVQVQGNGFLFRTPQLQTTTGAISINGTATVGDNHGVVLLNTVTLSSANAGAIDLVGTGSGAGYGVYANASNGATIQATTTGGNISVVADTMALKEGLGTVVFTTTGTGSVTLRQKTIGRAIDFGGADGASLGITNAEFNTISADSVFIGDADTGGITVTGIMNPTNVNLITLGASTTFAAGSSLVLDIDSLTDYERLVVNGDLTIDPAAGLSIVPGSITPGPTDEFALIQTILPGFTFGEFTSYPSSTIVSFTGVDKEMSYFGGDFDDIYLVPRTFPPTVAAIPATAITSTTAEPGLEILSDGGIGVPAKGIVIAKTADNPTPTIGGFASTRYDATGHAGTIYTIPLTGLQPGTQYSFRAFGGNFRGTTYSAPLTFTTLGAGPALVNDAVTTGSGTSTVYPLANDPDPNVTIAGVSNPAILIAADGRSLMVPEGFTGSFTYTTSAGGTATVDVTGGTPIIKPVRYTGLLYDSTGAITGWSQMRFSSKGSGTLQVRASTDYARTVFTFAVDAQSGTVSTSLGAVGITRNANGTVSMTLAHTSGMLTGTLRAAPTSNTPVKYHIALASIDSAIPGGGFLVANVRANGSTVVNGVLPDGKNFSSGSAVTDNGTIAFYGVQRNGVRPPGLVGGELVPANLTLTDITGEVAWNKPVQQLGTTGMHRTGVDTLLTANGSIYAGALPSGLTGPGTLSLSGGNLLANESNAVTIAAGVPSMPAGSVIKWGEVKPAVGKFRPQVIIPGLTRPVIGSGVYLPKSNRAWGYFPGVTVGGRVELTVP